MKNQRFVTIEGYHHSHDYFIYCCSATITFKITVKNRSDRLLYYTIFDYLEVNSYLIQLRSLTDEKDNSGGAADSYYCAGMMKFSISYFAHLLRYFKKYYQVVAVRNSSDVSMNDVQAMIGRTAGDHTERLHGDLHMTTNGKNRLAHSFPHHSNCCEEGDDQQQGPHGAHTSPYSSFSSILACCHRPTLTTSDAIDCYFGRHFPPNGHNVDCDYSHRNFFTATVTWRGPRLGGSTIGASDFDVVGEGVDCLHCCHGGLV